MLNYRSEDEEDREIILPMSFLAKNLPDVTVLNKAKTAAMGTLFIIRYRLFIFTKEKIVTSGACDWSVPKNCIFKKSGRVSLFSRLT